MPPPGRPDVNSPKNDDDGLLSCGRREGQCRRSLAQRRPERDTSLGAPRPQLALEVWRAVERPVAPGRGEVGVLGGALSGRDRISTSGRGFEWVERRSDMKPTNCTDFVSTALVLSGSIREVTVLSKIGFLSMA